MLICPFSAHSRLTCDTAKVKLALLIKIRLTSKDFFLLLLWHFWSAVESRDDQSFPGWLAPILPESTNVLIQTEIMNRSSFTLKN